MSFDSLQARLPGQLQPLSPFGLVVQATPGSDDSIESIAAESLQPVLLEHRLVLFRGFRPIDDIDHFSGVCTQWGRLLEWDFGTVFEVVEQPDPENYLFTSGSVPYHWDGAFADEVPWLQMFHCREAPGEDVGGETLFCNTTALWDSLSPETRLQWESVEIEYSTDKVAHYGGRIRARLVDRHPRTEEPVIRFAEPANATTVQLNTPELEVKGIPAGSVPGFLNELTRLIYDPRFVYSHCWQPGDFLIADNHVLLHARTKYRQSQPRRLWRVHVL